MFGVLVCPWYLDLVDSVATVRILNERLLHVRREGKREKSGAGDEGLAGKQ